MPTLQDLVLALGVPFRDNLYSTTTADAGPANQLIDNALANDAAGLWNSSEVLFLDTGALTGKNPQIVKDSTADGTLTLSGVWTPGAGVPAGTEYVLLRVRGRGIPFRYRLDALRQVIEALPNEGVETEVVLPGGAQYGTYLYTIPAGLDTVYRVMLRSPVGVAPFYELGVPPARWQLRPGRQILISKRNIGRYQQDIVLHGRAFPTWSNDLTSTYHVQIADVVERAAELLTTFTDVPAQQVGHQNLQQERLRDSGEYLYPSEQWILD